MFPLSNFVKRFFFFFEIFFLLFCKRRIFLLTIKKKNQTSGGGRGGGKRWTNPDTQFITNNTSAYSTTYPMNIHIGHSRVRKTIYPVKQCYRQTKKEITGNCKKKTWEILKWKSIFLRVYPLYYKNVYFCKNWF